MIEKYTPFNFIKLDLASGTNNIMRCQVCGASDILPIKDQFLGITIEYEDSQGFKRRKFLDIPKKLLAYFESVHLQLHFNMTSKDNKRAKKKAVTV